MAKKFMYVCLGVLALTLAFHLGARYGEAGYVDHSTTGVVAAAPDGRYFLFEDGTVHTFDTINGWSPSSSWDLPIPVSQVKFWVNEGFFISTDDEAWDKGSFAEEWINYGPPPGTVSTQPTTWSRVKAEFGE
jgi:hypothetical protein